MEQLSFEQVITLLDKILHYQLFKLDSTPITISSVIVFAGVFAVWFIAARFFADRILKRLLSRVSMDSGTRYTFRRVTFYAIVAIGAVFSFQFIGIDLSGLAVIFGLLSVGIGFGLQNVTSNFISGLILLFERPIKIGDRVTVGDTEGDVMEIRMRTTTIRTLNNIMMIVPNSEFVSSRVINWSYKESSVRVDLDVGVSYNSDIDVVNETLLEVAHNHPQVLEDPRPDVLLRRFGDSAWDMQLRVWIREAQEHPVIRSEINCAIVRAFREKNIEIPFPQRDLHVRTMAPAATSSNGNVEMEVLAS